MYFYQDTSGLFHIGNEILPSGKLFLKKYASDTVIALESTAQKLYMYPIKVTDLQRENSTYYPDLSTLLNEIGEFFEVSGSGTLTGYTREIYFYYFQEVMLQHSVNEEIVSEILTDEIISLEYSTDNGILWIQPVYPLSVLVNTTTLWRVKLYNNEDRSGNVILKSTI